MSQKNYELVRISDYARLTSNSLREVKFDLKMKSNPAKQEITFQLGDPSIFGNFPPAKGDEIFFATSLLKNIKEMFIYLETIDALKNSVELDKYCYNAAWGRQDAREAVVEYSQHHGNLTADDVVLTSGCSHAIEMCILTLVSPGENLLIPRPCYE